MASARPPPPRTKAYSPQSPSTERPLGGRTTGPSSSLRPTSPASSHPPPSGSALQGSPNAKSPWKKPAPPRFSSAAGQNNVAHHGKISLRGPPPPSSHRLVRAVGFLRGASLCETVVHEVGWYSPDIHTRPVLWLYLSSTHKYPPTICYVCVVCRLHEPLRVFLCPSLLHSLTLNINMLPCLPTCTCLPQESTRTRRFTGRI